MVWRLCVAFLLIWNGAAFAADPFEKAIQFPVEKYQLKNGLTVLLHPDHSIPAVSVHQWFRVGSKDEVPGRTGLAHFFEHMMFKGTSKYGEETWGAFLNSKGAEYNAFTSYDYTGYYIDAPSEHLLLLLHLEADRMRNLMLDPKAVQSEREVVKEERRMRYENSIEGGIREKMASLMFEVLPYKWLPIGSMADLNAASMADLQAFYKTYYSPNNAVLVVGGAFDRSQVKRWIEETHGSLPKEPIKRPPVKAEPRQTKERRATITREAQAPSVAIGYRLPDMKHPDLYALDLLGILLGQGRSSRLYKSLVYEKEVATSSSAYAWGQTLAGQFVIHVSLKPSALPNRVTVMIEDEVRKLRDLTITEKELEKARNILMMDYVDGLKRISGRTRMLAQYETLLGDYRRIFTDLKEYRKVTTADIKRVANVYLQPTMRNIVIVNPRKSGGAQ